MNEFQFNPKNVLDLTLNGGQIARMLLIAEIQTGKTVAQLVANMNDNDFSQEQEPITSKEAFLGMVENMRIEIEEGRQPKISELELRQARALSLAKTETEKVSHLSRPFGWGA